MKAKTLVIGLILAAFVLAPLAMAAEEPPQRGPRGGQGQGPRGSQRQGPRGDQGQGLRGQRGFGRGFDPLGRVLNQLDLTAEQQEKVDAIREENRDKTRQTRTAVREAMQTLNEATEKGTEAEIIAAGKTLGDAFTQQALHRAKTTKQIKAVLTEEQLKELDKLQTEMKERMQQRRQQGPQGPQGGPGGPDGPREPRPPQD